MPCGALVLRLAENMAPKTGYLQRSGAMGLEVTGDYARLLPATGLRFQERVSPDPASNTDTCRGCAMWTVAAEDQAL